LSFFLVIIFNFLCTTPHVFVRKSSSGAQTNGRRKCWCCETMPGPMQTTNNIHWRPSGSLPCHIRYIHRIWPHIMPCLTIWPSPNGRRVGHYVAADSLTTTTCRAKSAGRCELSRKTDLLSPSGSYQKDGNGALTSVGSMWSVLKCDSAAVVISQPVFQASPNHF
jgi:hypothetical protein